MRRAASSITGNIQVNTLGGNDTLTINFDTGAFPQPISYDGGTQTTSDTLVIGGGSTFTNVTHTFNSASSGNVAATGVGIVTYTGLEPVTDNMAAVGRVFTFTGGAETITLADAAGANMTIDSTLGEIVTFANPTDSLTINAGTGADTVTIASVDADGPFNVDLTINGDADGDTINLNADITFAANENLNVDLANDAVAGDIDSISVGGNANLILSGTGAAALSASRTVMLSAGSSISVVNGGLTLNANQQATPTSGGFEGVNVAGVIQSSGTGNISIAGRGGSGDTNSLRGVVVQSAGLVTSTGTGTITVQGTGGTSTGGPSSSGNNTGVLVVNSNSAIISNSGAIQITGQGGDSTGPLSSGLYGVMLTDSGKIQTSGAGTLTINGTGGNVTSGGSGAVTSSGVLMSDFGLIASTGTGVNAGAINITAIASAGGAGSSQGFRTETQASVTTVDGPLAIDRTGGTCSLLCLGLSISGSVTTPNVTATGTGAINLTGTGGSGGTSNIGANVLVGGVVSVKNGNLTVTGTGGSGADNTAFTIGNLSTGTLQTTRGTGSITVVADSMDINTTDGTINGGANAVTLRQNTNGTLIDLGGADASGTLGLTDAELDRVTAGTLNIGNSGSGTITVSADITRAVATNMALTSDGDVVISGGQVNTGGGTLLLDPGASPDAVKPTKSATDVTASTLSFGSDLAIVINGTTVDTQYNQLNVAGIVNITGVTLALSGSHSPLPGQQFIIVNNDSNDAIIGTFTGLAEGATIPNFLGSSMSATITYIGGDSNDAVLTVFDPCPAQSTVYVDDSWVGTTPGTDPDGVGGPATNFGCDSFATIQDGVNAVTNPGTVIVYAGTYTETVTVNKQLSIRGMQFGVDARTRVAVPESIVNGAGGSFILTANGIALDGFTVQDASTTTAAGIVTDVTASGYQIRNNIIRANRIGLYLRSSGAVQTVVEQNLIRDNNLTGGSNAGNGVFSDGTFPGLSNALIQNNRFAGTHQTRSLSLTNSSSIVITTNAFEDGNATTLTNVDGSQFTSNALTGSQPVGFTVAGLSIANGTDNLLVSLNTFTNRGNVAAIASSATSGSNLNVTISGNTVTHDVTGSTGSRVVMTFNRFGGTSNITENSITLTGALPASAKVHGMDLSGSTGTVGTVNILRNTINGGNTDVVNATDASVGVAISPGGLGGAPGATITVSNNFINGWVNGVSTDTAGLGRLPYSRRPRSP